VSFSSYKYYADPEFLHAEYLVARKSAKQIARECGCSHSTILKHLRDLEIQIRRNGNEYQIGQVPYGIDLKHGRPQVNDVELAVIEQIKAMRARGLSYHQIADILNMLSIATKQKGARWHATTVMKILKRPP
jgi:DNA-binding CsgD family transcriptional regulator